MSSIKKHLSGCEKRRRKAEVEASVSQHPKISSFFSASTLTTATGSSPLLTADQFPSEPFGSSSTADGNTVTVVTHHVGDLFSAVVHTEPATEAPPACIEESFQVPASDESIQMDNSQCEDVTETVHQDGAVFLHQMETDPALWSISENMIQYWLRVGPELCRNRDGVYTNSTRQGKSIRKLNDTAFTTLSPNGEKVERNWLMYSPSTGCVFCFVCKLFSINSASNSSSLATTGFDSWDHIGRLNDHERSVQHRESLSKYAIRLAKHETIDRCIIDSYARENSYWKEVLRRVVSVVTFLVTRGLALRGSNEVFGSEHNGNYLGCLELLSEYDPFLAQHIEKYGNRGRGNPSYLSSTICEEFVLLMAEEVRQVIINEIASAKYYSFSVDSTPDISHTDQLTFTVRYVHDAGIPTERFLKFEEIHSHTGLNLFNTIIDILKDFRLDLKDCRGQSYDNASNMSGKYSGVQARVLEENNKASYIPCMAHSLNLSGVSAAESCVNAVSFFGFVEKLYVFFSASTHRWNLLRTVLSAVNAVERSLLPKRLCETRWSSRSDALKSLSQHYKVYHDVLQQIADDPLQKCDTRSEALAMANIMDTLETVFMTVFWSALLQRIHESSQLLQSTTIEIGSAIAVLKSLLGFLEAQRSLFDDYKARAVAISKTPCFKEVRVRRAKRVFGDSSEPDVVMSSEEKFRIETFYAILDRIVTDLNNRIRAYSETDTRFLFLRHHELENFDAVKDSLSRLTSFYSDDLDAEIFDEWLQWTEFEKALYPKDASRRPAHEMLSTLRKHHVESAFPNIFIALRIYLTLPVSNCTGERSFSHLKRIKNALRSTMGQERLSSLAILNIESELVREIDYSKLIANFAELKLRRKPV